MDFNIIYIVFMVAIGTCALFSPMLVARANNKHQLELKKLEISDFEKRTAEEIISGYFRFAGAAVAQGTTENITKFGEYSHLIYFYVSPEYHDEISRLNKYILSTFEYEKALLLLDSISKQMSEAACSKEEIKH